jgi:hypothetical protein
MTFRGWLIRQTHRRDPIGDLARVALADPAWKGRTASSLGERLLVQGAPLRTHNALGRAILGHQAFLASRSKVTYEPIQESLGDFAK